MNLPLIGEQSPDHLYRQFLQICRHYIAAIQEKTGKSLIYPAPAGIELSMVGPTDTGNCTVANIRLISKNSAPNMTQRYGCGNICIQPNTSTIRVPNRKDKTNSRMANPKLIKPFKTLYITVSIKIPKNNKANKAIRDIDAPRHAFSPKISVLFNNKYFFFKVES